MNRPLPHLALAFATLCMAALTGCTLNSNPASITPTTANFGVIKGQAYGGNQPVTGATVTVYAAATSGYGAASTQLGTTTMTDGNGAFSITGTYTCTAGQQIYIYVNGGNTGAGTNVNAGFLALLGQCPAGGGDLSTVTPYAWVNEVSTVAAAYAISGFAVDATHVANDATATGNTTAALATVGMANAFANSGNLENIANGTAYAVPPNASTVVAGTTNTPLAPQLQVNTIANILASCVNTASSVASPSAACTTLFAAATSDGTATGTKPTDTATAAINIAHHPSANVATLYGLTSATSPFQPTASAQPADFTLSIFYPNGASGTVGIAADALGNIFTTYGGSNYVYKYSPAGVVTSYQGTATTDPNGLALAPRHLAIDVEGGTNYIWVPTTNGTSTNGTITKFDENLTLLSQYNAVDTTVTPNQSVFTIGALTFAPDGSLWALGGKGYALHLSNAGTVLGSLAETSAVGGAAVISGANDIAINGTGTIAITGGSGTSSVLLFTSAGVETVVTTAGSGGAATPSGIVADGAGNFWVSNNPSTAPTSGVVPDFTPAGAIVTGAPFATSGTNGAQFVTGEFDGLGNYYTGGSATAAGIYQLNSSGTQMAVFTPATTSSTGTVLTTPDNMFFAVDPSGNLWYGGKSYVGEMIGVAAPKITPIATGTALNKGTSRP